MRLGDGRVRRTIRHHDEPFQAHELTFSCFRGRPFLSRERTRVYLAEALHTARSTIPFHLWAYVIMPEHVHLLVWPAEAGVAVESILKSVKQSVARRAIGFLRRENPAGLKHLATGDRRSPYAFWQDGPGYDRNITSNNGLEACLNYIHNNPVRRGLVQQGTDWKWSSALDWSGERLGPIPLDLEFFPKL